MAISRDRRVLGGIAIVAVLALIVAGALYGGRAWNRFTSSDLGTPSGLTEASSRGRIQFWDVALEAFSEVAVRRELGSDRLQRDRPLERELRRSEDDAHPSAPRDGLESASREG